MASLRPWKMTWTRFLVGCLREETSIYVECRNLLVCYERCCVCAAGKAPWKAVLQEFWHPFNRQLQEVMQIGVREIIDELDGALGPHLFPAQVLSPTSPNTIPAETKHLDCQCRFEDLPSSDFLA